MIVLSFLMAFSPILVAGLFLMVFPLWIFRAKGTRLVGFEQRAWPTGRNLALGMLDAGRASVGVWLVVQAVSVMPAVEVLGRWQDAVYISTAIAGGLAVQAFAWRDEDYLLAPVPYALGAAAIVSYPVVLVIAFPLAVGGALALRAWSAGFIAGGAGLLLAGLAVEQQDWHISSLVGLALGAPVLLSVLAGRHLGWAKRQA
jgi:hypothetical protein